jgi:hypothetical protein
VTKAKSQLPVLLLALLIGLTTAGSSQQRAEISDPERAEIHSILRRFYFNLDRRDWEALTSDILPAKVMAHRPIPTSLLPPFARDFIEESILARGEDGDWVGVVVPRCSADEFDQFRLVRFENRWRFVYIHLAQQHDLYTGR